MEHVSPEERKTFIENGTLPSSILTYSYNAGGLVTQVKKNNVPLVKFFYNDRNHRVKKETYGGTNGDKISSTHYVRDVGGQVMAIYMEPQNATPKVVEYPVYGSGRIGIYKPGSTPKTLYELTDHLGNLRTVFSVTDTNSGLTNEGYSDYYPFGMPMPGRNIVGDYRYAFQGQEKDSETGKEAFQLRLWDSRIGRWLTTDPYGQHASPYLGMGNNPIRNIDPDGGLCVDAQGNSIPCDDVYTGGQNFNGPTTETLNVLDEVVVTNVTSMINGYENGLLNTLGSNNTTANGIGFNLLNTYNSREYYIKNASKLRKQFTNAEGVIDYAGGIAARTELKNYVRNKRTPYPGKVLLDKFTNNTPRSTTPRFWKTNKLVNGLGKASGVAGGAIVVYDAAGVYNYFTDPTSGHVVHPVRFGIDAGNSGALYYGGIYGASWYGGWTAGTYFWNTDLGKTIWPDEYKIRLD